MTTLIISIFSIIVIGQLLYIIRLRAAIRYAIQVLQKYETALAMDDIIRKVNENESKRN